MRRRDNYTRGGIAALLSCALLCLSLLTGCGGQPGAEGQGQKQETTAAVPESAEETAADQQIREGEAGEEIAEEAFRTADPSEAVIGLCLDHLGKDLGKEDPKDRELPVSLLKALESSGFSDDRILREENSDETEELTAAVRRLLEGGADILIVEPGDAEMSQEETDAAARAVCGLAMEARVPVIFVRQQPSPEEQSRWKAMEQPVTYIGAEFTSRGTAQAQVVETLGSDTWDKDRDGTLRYLYVTEEHGSQDTLAGALARQLKERKIQAECFGTLRDGKSWEEDLRSALSQHGKTLEMIVCSDDDLAEDVLETAREAGREPGKDLLVLGAGAEEDLLKEILSGAAAGTVYYDSITESAAIAAAAVKLCALEVPDPLILDPVAVTNANAQEIRDYRNSFLK